MLPSEAAPDQMFFVDGGGSGRQRSGSRITPAVHRNKKLRFVAPVQHPTHTKKHDQNANAPPHVVLDYDDSAPPPNSGSAGGGPAGAGGGRGGAGQNKRTVEARKVEKIAVAVGGVDDLAAISDGDNDVAPPQSSPAQDYPTHIIIRVDDDDDSIENVGSEGGGGGGGMATGDTGGGDAGRNKGVCIKGEEVAAVATVFSGSRPTQAPKAEDDVDDSADNVKNGGGGGGKAGIGGDGGDCGTNGYNMAFMPIKGSVVGERDGMILPCGADDLVAEFVPDLTEDGPRYNMVDEYDDDSMGSVPSGTGGGGSVGAGTGGGGTGTNGPKSKSTTKERMVIPKSEMSVM